MNKIKHFNIRVYSLIINKAKDVLLSDEYVLDQKMTKFPGGGLEFGEGPADCVHREAIEEFGQDVEIIDHFYTTHFFQKAKFYDDHQLIGIFYLVNFVTPIKFKISKTPFDFPHLVNGSQSFRWSSIKDLSDNKLSFPIDQYVAKLLQQKFC